MSQHSAAAGEAGAEERAAVLAGVACYFFWGFLPLLFNAAKWAGATAWEIVAWRTVWSLGTAGLLVAATRQVRATAVLFRSARTIGWLMLSAAFIGGNWSLFIWAANNGHLIDSSLGYYLNPLLSMAAGMILFKERIDRAGWIAIVLAGTGVVVQTLATGALPVIALVLAFSFCMYSVIRKHVRADAAAGLFVECLVLAGPGLAYGLWLQSTGAGHAGRPMVALLLALTGPATVAPLAAFTWAARRMPLSTLGFLQFISPSMQMVIAVLSGEALSPLSLLAFALIWIGVAIYAWDAWRRARAVAYLGQVSGDAASTSPQR